MWNYKLKSFLPIEIIFLICVQYSMATGRTTCGTRTSGVFVNRQNSSNAPSLMLVEAPATTINPPTLDLPDRISNFYNLTAGNHSLLYHIGYRSALKSARLGYSHKNVYVILLGGISGSKSDFLHTILHSGRRSRPVLLQQQGRKITEYSFPISAPELGLSNAQLKIIDVPELLPLTNFNANDAVLSGLHDFIQNHAELKSRLPNLVLVFSTFNPTTFQVSENSEFIQLFDKVRVFQRQLFKADYSNALFIGSTVSSSHEILSTRHEWSFQLALQRQLITGNAGIFSSPNISLSELPRSKGFSSRLTELMKRTGDSFGNAVLGKIFHSLEQGDIMSLPHLGRIAISEIQSNYRFQYPLQESLDTAVNRILLRKIEEMTYQPYDSDTELEVMKKILIKQNVTSQSDLPVRNSNLVQLFRTMTKILNPELVSAVARIPHLQFQAPSLNVPIEVGQSFNVLADAVLSKSPFQIHTAYRATTIGFNLPGSVNAEIYEDVVPIFNIYKSTSDYFYQRIHRLNLLADYGQFSGHVPTGVNILGAEKLTGLQEFRKFKLSINTETISISEEFQNAVETLPLYSRERSESMKVWRSFFVTWGTHVVQSCFGGGAIKISMENSYYTSNFEMPDSLIQLFELFDDSGSFCWSPNFSLIGGSHSYKNSSSRLQIRDWESSLRSNPKILSNDRNLVGIVEIVRRVSPVVAIDAAKALRDYFLGHLGHTVPSVAQELRETQVLRLQDLTSRNLAEIKTLAMRVNALTSDTKSSQTQIATNADRILSKLISTQNSMEHQFEAQSEHITQQDQKFDTSLNEIQQRLQTLKFFVDQNHQALKNGQAEETQRIYDFLTLNTEILQRLTEHQNADIKNRIIQGIDSIKLSLESHLQSYIKNYHPNTTEPLRELKNQIVHLTLLTTGRFRDLQASENYNFENLTQALSDTLTFLDSQHSHFHNLSKSENSYLVKNETQKMMMALQSENEEAIRTVIDKQLSNSQKFLKNVSTQFELTRNIVQQVGGNVKDNLTSEIQGSGSQVSDQLSQLMDESSLNLTKLILKVKQKIENMAIELSTQLNYVHDVQNQSTRAVQLQLQLDFKNLSEQLELYNNKSDSLAHELVVNQTKYLISKLESTIAEHHQGVTKGQDNTTQEILRNLTSHAREITDVVQASSNKSTEEILASVAEALGKLEALTAEHSRNSSNQRFLYFLAMETQMKNQSMESARRLNILRNSNNQTLQMLSKIEERILAHQTLKHNETMSSIMQLVHLQVQDLISNITASSHKLENEVKRGRAETTSQILTNLLKEAESINENIRNSTVQTFQNILKEITDIKSNLEDHVTNAINNSSNTLKSEIHEIGNSINNLTAKANQNFRRTKALIEEKGTLLQDKIDVVVGETQRNQLRHHDNLSSQLGLVNEGLQDKLNVTQNLVGIMTRKDLQHGEEVKTLTKTLNDERESHNLARIDLLRNLQNFKNESQDRMNVMQQMLNQIRTEGHNRTTGLVQGLVTQRETFNRELSDMLNQIVTRDADKLEERKRHDKIIEDIRKDLKDQIESHSKLVDAALAATREDMRSKNEQNDTAIKTVATMLEKEQSNVQSLMTVILARLN